MYIINMRVCLEMIFHMRGQKAQKTLYENVQQSAGTQSGARLFESTWPRSFCGHYTTVLLMAAKSENLMDQSD